MFTTKTRNKDLSCEETKQAVAEFAQEVKEYIGCVDSMLVRSPITAPKKEEEIGMWCGTDGFGATFDVQPAKILLKWSYIQGFVFWLKVQIKQNIGALSKRKETANSEEESIYPKVELPLENYNFLDKHFPHRAFTWGGMDPNKFRD